jgi:CheY-like chemotaxis protein
MLSEKKRILIVDDEKDTVDLAEMVLEEFYHVFTLNNGEEAIDFLTHHKEKPHLVILDILMPKINGIEVCRWIKQHSQLKHIPVILFTVMARKKDQLEGKKAGCDDFITKPISIDDLLALLETYLN